MTVLSILRGFSAASRPATTLPQLLSRQCKNPEVPIRTVVMTAVQKQLRSKDPHNFEVHPSKFYWHQYKNLVHFYFCLGALPLTALVFLVNIFVGPATLTEIPPGYTPKHWEYFRNPITRFLARYGFWNPQELYERNLYYITQDYEERDMRLMEWKVKRLMKERGDYPNIYQRRVIQGKYLRGLEEERKANRVQVGIS